LRGPKFLWHFECERQRREEIFWISIFEWEIFEFLYSLNAISRILGRGLKKSYNHKKWGVGNKLRGGPLDIWWGSCVNPPKKYRASTSDFKTISSKTTMTKKISRKHSALTLTHACSCHAQIIIERTREFQNAVIINVTTTASTHVAIVWLHQ
jgi:hypothetical protein